MLGLRKSGAVGENQQRTAEEAGMGHDTDPKAREAQPSEETSTGTKDAAQPQGRVSRRFFLSGLGAAGLAVSAPPLLGAVPLEQAAKPSEEGVSADAVPGDAACERQGVQRAA